MLCNAYGLIFWCFVLKYGAIALDFTSQNNINTSNLVKMEILPSLLQRFIISIHFLKPCKCNYWIIVNEVRYQKKPKALHNILKKITYQYLNGY